MRAEDMSVSLEWKRKTVPGVGHDNLEMVPAAVQVFFEKTPRPHQGSDYELQKALPK